MRILDSIFGELGIPNCGGVKFLPTYFDTVSKSVSRLSSKKGPAMFGQS